MSDTGDSGFTTNFLLGGITFVPDPAGFDALLRQNGPVGAALKRWARAVQETARQYAPKDTHRLERSIDIAYYKNEEGIYADVGSDVFYAGFQELGTSRNPPHPYLRPALYAVMSELDSAPGAEVVFGYDGEGDYEGINEVIDGG